MFALLIHENFNASTILGLCSKKLIFVYFWSWHCSVRLGVSQLWPKYYSVLWKQKRYEIMEYSHEGRGIKESKHLFVIQPLTLLPHVPSSFMSLYTPYFPMSPLRMPAQMALQQPALPVGAAGMGGFLALCPYHHPQSLQEPKSVLAPRLNGEVQRPSQSGCWATWWLPGSADNRDSTKYHTYVTAHASQLNQTSALLLLNGVWVELKTDDFIVSWKNTCKHTCTHTAAKHKIELQLRYSGSPPIPQPLSVVGA